MVKSMMGNIKTHNNALKNKTEGFGILAYNVISSLASYVCDCTASAQSY